jgi:hypothetical protein
MYLPLKEQRVLAKRARGIPMARPMQLHRVGREPLKVSAGVALFRIVLSNVLICHIAQGNAGVHF